MGVLLPSRGEAERRAPWGMEPGRLWSLWDVMRDFKASQIIWLGDYLSAKPKDPPEWFLWLAARIPFYRVARPITEMERASYIAVFKDFYSMCVECDLTSSAITITKLLQESYKDNVRFGDLTKYDAELLERLKDELEVRKFFSLTLRESEHYLQPLVGWEEVVTRFPNARHDVEEARKCLALSRYGACVFHILQIVEFGLIELGHLIGVKDPHPGWTATTAKMAVILGTKFPGRTNFQREHWKFIEQIQATTEVLKSAWRNKVSHAQGKLVLLTSEFSPEIAEEILFAARSFMRRLAVEAPANPDPEQ